MRSSRNIRMDGNREDKLIILAVKVVKVIPPDIFDIPGIHEPMAVGCLLDVHHRRKVINVPIGGNFDEAGVLALDVWLHPFFCFLRVVDFGPRIACLEVVCLAVFVAHAVVVFDSVVEEKLGAFSAGFPPVFDFGSAQCVVYNRVEEATYHGATLPRGGLPANSVNIR